MREKPRDKERLNHMIEAIEGAEIKVSDHFLDIRKMVGR